MSVIKNILLFIFLLCGLAAKEQVTLSPNYVNNPSFEEYYNCPSGSGQLYECKYWWGLSTDYFNACAAPISTGCSVPSNFAGYQSALSGEAYADAVIYTNRFTVLPDRRETIKAKLNDSLIANKRYCTNFYVSLSEISLQSYNSYYVLLDSIGLLFTKDSVLDSITAISSNGIKVQNSIFNIDTINWFKISNSFVASGGEQYLTIGNFDDYIYWPPGKKGQTDVYIDDISVCECSFKFNLGNDTTLCEGETLQLKVSIPNATYTWQDGSHDSTFTVTQGGTYYVSAFFPDYNITTYDTINVTYIPYPVVNLGNSTILCQGQTLLLNASTNNATYLWQDGSTAPTFNATQDSTYWVKVTDTTANCSTTATIKLECDAEPVIPNIFTPNGDGSNDNFVIKNIEYWDINLQVFNRWGNEVYNVDNYQNNWDGKYKGNPVSDGTYFYIIKAKGKDSGREKEYKGSLMIMR